MMRLLIAALLLLPLAGIACAQQATPAEQVAVLAARLGSAETELNNTMLLLVRERSKAAELAQQVERWKTYARPLYTSPPAEKPSTP